LAQWRQKRTPWVCVSILLPMEPLGQVETSWKQAQSIGETVQAALMAGPL
jgi:cyanoexosortase B-associated protein